MQGLSDLRHFCQCLVREFGSPGALTEEQKAEEFYRLYLDKLPPTIKTLQVVAEACGIKVNALPRETMPQNLRGYHDVYENRRNIYYKKGDAVSGIENTILHEIREMMEAFFAEAYPTYEPLRTIARHTAANRFASAVLLPKREFVTRVYDSGFDVPALAKVYSKSASQVLLRMGEVLQGQLFFFGALYEPDGQSPTTWRVSYWTGTRNDDADENIYGLDDFFPRKGREATPASLVEMTIQKGRPHYCRCINVTSDDDGGLTAITQPVVNSGGTPARVVLVALLGSSAHLLSPQVKRTKPIIVESLDRHL